MASQVLTASPSAPLTSGSPLPEALAHQLGAVALHLGLGLVEVGAVGAVVGIRLARGVEMTGMPQLSAMLHSFVGLAAVLVGDNSFIAPSAQARALGAFHLGEIFLGVFIGGVTLTGSIIAYLKLSARIKGAPLTLPGRNSLNLGALVVSALLMVVFLRVEEGSALSWIALLLMTVVALALGLHLVAAIGGEPAREPVYDSPARWIAPSEQDDAAITGATNRVGRITFIR